MRTAKILLWCFVIASLGAQTLQIEGPVSGFVFDESSGALRPIIGVPGAAFLGDPLVSELAWASVAPGGRAALVHKDGALFSLTGLPASGLAWSRIENAQLRPERAAWSENGAVALIYSAAAGAAQRIRNLADAPVADDPAPLGEVSALAVDSEGRIIAGTPEGVVLIAAGAARPLLPGVRAAAFTIAGADLLVAGGNGEIWRVQNYAGEAAPERLAAAEDPVGIAVSPDGKYLFVADRGQRLVQIYELAVRAPIAQLAADAEPMMLVRLSATDLWLLRSSSGPSEPLLLLKTSPEPGIWFVPVGKGE